MNQKRKFCITFTLYFSTLLYVCSYIRIKVLLNLAVGFCHWAMLAEVTEQSAFL